VGAALDAINSTGIKYFHANSTAPDSQALGMDSVAIGPKAISNYAGDIALGAGSVTAATVATPSATINGTLYTFAGGAPISTVSVGAPGAERTITNVAAGRINASSTDAINGSQLNAADQAIAALSSKVNSLGSTVANNLGGGSSYNTSTGAVTSPTYGNVGNGSGGLGNNVGGGTGPAANVSSGLQAAANTWITGNPTTYTPPLATGANSTAAGSGAVSTGNNSVALGGNSSDSGRANVVSVGAAGAERQITNVAAGTQSTDAVNLSQLNSAIGQSNANVTQQLNGLQQNVNNVARNAYAGVGGGNRADDDPRRRQGQNALARHRLGLLSRLSGRGRGWHRTCDREHQGSGRGQHEPRQRHDIRHGRIHAVVSRMTQSTELLSTHSS